MTDEERQALCAEWDENEQELARLHALGTISGGDFALREKMILRRQDEIEYLIGKEQMRERRQ
ncbi:MAG TPA: hypothetical protein VD971_11960 [Phycisphaerales bacterium]|nr:hypothetical protein [Phycisphaerales bacterium]